MTDRDINELRTTVLETLEKTLIKVAQACDVESALSEISHTAWTTLGDPKAADRVGALKSGEQQFSVSGYFMISQDNRENILIAEHGFPEEQHRLRIPAGLGHPGWVTKHQAALLLENTDDHANFKEILKTARMGSAMYSPMIWDGHFLGQLITASQARNTYGEPDHDLHRIFAHSATAVFIARGGSKFISGLFSNDPVPSSI